MSLSTIAVIFVLLGLLTLGAALYLDLRGEP